MDTGLCIGLHAFIVAMQVIVKHSIGVGTMGAGGAIAPPIFFSF